MTSFLRLINCRNDSEPPRFQRSSDTLTAEVFMPGDGKYERQLWKTRVVLTGTAFALAAVFYVVRHLSGF
jgi:hypothetical protein